MPPGLTEGWEGPFRRFWKDISRHSCAAHQSGNKIHAPFDSQPLHTEIVMNSCLLAREELFPRQMGGSQTDGATQMERQTGMQTTQGQSPDKTNRFTLEV